MKDWLKFYFGGFFSNKIARTGAERRSLNAILSCLLAFFLICLGLLVGYVTTFGHHYAKADGFKSFMYSVFADDAENRVNLSVSGGRLYAELPDGSQFINTVEDDMIANRYASNGYDLFIDMRELDTYARFEMVCADSDGGKISYEDYVALPAAEKSRYTLSVVTSCYVTDITTDRDEYIALLDEVSDETSEAYDKTIATEYEEVKQQKSEDKITEEKYGRHIYDLYIRAYYSEYDFSESGVPALSNYYADYNRKNEHGRFVMLLCDGGICVFETSEKIEFSLVQEYKDIGNITVSADRLSQSERRAGVDKFIDAMFYAGAENAFFVYLLSAGRTGIFYALGIAVLVLILFIITHKLRCPIAQTFGQVARLVCSFMFYSALFTFFISWILALFMSREAAFTVTGIVFISILVVRTLILFVPAFISAARNPETDDDGLPEILTEE